jgi:hypothetical protein
MHPLDNLDKFIMPDVQPVELPVVSVVLETRPEMFGVIEKVIKWHRRWFKFKMEIVISDKDPSISGVQFVRCQPPPSGNAFKLWYSDICIRWLSPVCAAHHMLMWQWDGFIINPALWKNEFMNYDYIGSPIYSGHWLQGAVWLQANRTEWKDRPIPVHPIVGNGGFSLRSKRFIEVSTTLPFDFQHDRICQSENEDFHLCVKKRKEMEDAGMKFCPADLAGTFSQSVMPLHYCFGFHGSNNLVDAKEYLESRYLPKGDS